MNPRDPHPALSEHDCTVLVLQGGGALGAYQGGAYEGFAEAGAHPNWVAGVSIGAINAALIAGNPPEARVERLREFWWRMSASMPWPADGLPGPLRALRNRGTATAAGIFGIPGFFSPRWPAEWLSALSVYDTAPLEQTLRELVDFERINHGDVRLSVGAVNVRSGNSVYFDSRHCRIGPEHILASGALPPGFPPVLIGGQPYWDGGMVSNSPLWYVFDEAPDLDALVLQVDLFSARGKLPGNLDEVQERMMDIRYSSKTRFNSSQLHGQEELKAATRRLLAKLPPALQGDPDVQRLAGASRPREISLVHLINRHDTRSGSVKDYEFSRATVEQLWNAGLDDARRSTHHADWCHAAEHHDGMRVFDFTR